MGKKPRRQNLKRPGRCIFCGGPGMSKEHLFSDWLRDLFPRSPDDTHTLGIADEGPYRLIPQQGHSGTKKIRTVCQTCNSGWVSAIDDAAKAVAPPIIRGERVSISPEMQKALATWLCKIAMVGDSRNRARSLVSQPQRNLMMKDRRPPNEWEVWIASYAGTEFRDLAFFQRSGKLDFTPVTGPGEKFSGYVELTFFGIGGLAALVIGDDLPDVDFNVGTFANLSRRIWPIGGGAIDWPLFFILGDDDARAVINILPYMVANFRNHSS